MIIEVTEIDDKFPITVTTGSLNVQILQSGLYRFEDGKASVINGKLRIRESGSDFTYKKGWTLWNPEGGYRAAKTVRNANALTLDNWSKNRSGSSPMRMHRRSGLWAAMLRPGPEVRGCGFPVSEAGRSCRARASRRHTDTGIGLTMTSHASATMRHTAKHLASRQKAWEAG